VIVEYCVLCCRSVLVAACEHNDLLMFDPHNGRLIGTRDAAHTDSVNCVRCVKTFVIFFFKRCLKTSLFDWGIGIGVGTL